MITHAQLVAEYKKLVDSVNAFGVMLNSYKEHKNVMEQKQQNDVESIVFLGREMDMLYFAFLYGKETKSGVVMMTINEFESFANSLLEDGSDYVELDSINICSHKFAKKEKSGEWTISLS